LVKLDFVSSDNGFVIFAVEFSL